MNGPFYALVTGASGQDGSHLLDLLLKDPRFRGVWAVVRRRGSGGFPPRLKHIAWSSYKHARLIEGDVSDGFFVSGVVSDLAASSRFADVRPRNIAVFNLAANSFVGSSWNCPEEHLKNNVGGLLNLLNAVQKHCPEAFVYQASSSEVFGTSPPPQDEETPFRPCSPYAVSKAAAHFLARCYRDKGVNVWSGILFNHEGERRGIEFVTQKVAFHVSRIVAYPDIGKPHFTLGNLDTSRDWGYAPEYMEYVVRMFLEHAAGGISRDIVLGTGDLFSIRDFIGFALKACGVAEPKPWIEKHVKSNPRFFRPSEPKLQARPEEARRLFGRIPRIKGYELAERMVRRWTHSNAAEMHETLNLSPEE